jgi:murein DD-endopeptidase MepM/ murein hydrolase activator NlpD
VFIYPVDSRRVTSKYGPRGTGFHNGVDFGAVVPGVEGDNIYAVADGIVKVSKVNGGGIKKGYGYYVILEHSNGYCSLYGHLRALEVKAGQKVEQGQIIGHMGNTGSSTGAHLHFEIRKGIHDWKFFHRNKKGQFISSINPLPFLKEKQVPVANTEEVSSWAKKSWEKAKEKGINDGKGAKNNVTEEQLMVFLDRLEEHLVKKYNLEKLL